jgi:AraC-like DNA-binding protein
MGRPRKPIDAEQVYKLARIGCTQAEIADVLGCSQAVISERFRSEFATARADWKTSLRRAQTIRAIRDRSDNMLIHLGKAHLGQGEKGGAVEATDDARAQDDTGNPIEP